MKQKVDMGEEENIADPKTMSALGEARGAQNEADCWWNPINLVYSQRS